MSCEAEGLVNRDSVAALAQSCVSLETFHS